MSDYPYSITDSRKVFCVTCEAACKNCPEGDEHPLRIFSSYQLAKHFCEERASREILGKTYEWHWDNYETLVVEVNDKYDMVYHIRDAKVEDDIPDDFRVPEIEKENRALMEENRQLRKEISDANVKIAKALSYATMWDGGYDYTKEAVLENLHVVRGILKGNGEGDKK